MNYWFLNILVCPHCGNNLKAEGEWQKEYLEEGQLSCQGCHKSWTVRNGIPRFIDHQNDYCESFGYQWMTFSRTQIDKFSRSNESEKRFINETGWDKKFLKNRLVLDAGCGAGRFADIALKMGSRVVAVDISDSVDICKKNLIELGYRQECFDIVQASIYELPFMPGIFDCVYSIGVIQHTPDRKKAVKSLAILVADVQGELAVWVYIKRWINLIGYKYWFRSITRWLSLKANWKISNLLVNIFHPLSWWIYKIPYLGRYLVKFLPIALRRPDGTRKQSKERSLLDTFDNLSPRYDKPIKESELRSWLKEFGMVSIERRQTPGLALVAKKE